VELVLLCDLDEPVHEDGAHVRVDVGLLRHVRRLRPRRLLQLHTGPDAYGMGHKRE
jgi:hypothetical protein